MQAVTAVAPRTFAPPEEVRDVYWDEALFAQAQRVARMFAMSSLVPQHLQGEDKIGDVVIALNIARKLGEDPLTVMQAIYVVGGRPAWTSQYLIARAQRHGIRIRWTVRRVGETPIPYERNEWDGPKGNRQRVKVKAAMADLEVTAHLHLPDGETADYTVTSRQAIAAGWGDNAQYTHSPELMLRYRAAAQGLSLYAPHIKLGLPTEHEATSAADAEVTYEDKQVTAQPAVRGIRAIDAAVEPEPVVEMLGAATIARHAQQTTSPAPAADEAEPSSSAVDDARALVACVKAAPGHALDLDSAKLSFKLALDLQRLRESRWQQALAAALMSGELVRTNGTLRAGPVVVNTAVSAAPDHVAVDEVSDAPVTDVEAGTWRDNLEMTIAECELQFETDTLVEIGTKAGMPVGPDGPVIAVDTPTTTLERYLELLRRRATV